jgi:nuclear pore complex protein Nup98-Nup96
LVSAFPDPSEPAGARSDQRHFEWRVDHSGRLFAQWTFASFLNVMARFGLGDDSDDDETIGNQPKPFLFTEKSKGTQKVPQVSPPMEAEESQYHYAYESRSRERVGSSDEDSNQMDQEDSVPPPWPSRIGMEPHKIHVMQASFFRVPEQEAAMKAAAQKATISGNSKSRLQADRLLNASARLPRKHSRGSDVGGEGGMLLDRIKVFCSSIQGVLGLTRSQRTTFDESLDPVPYRPTRKFTRVLGAKSVSTGQEGSYVDAGLAFGRSFRVSWGPGGQLARIGGPSRFLCLFYYLSPLINPSY